MPNMHTATVAAVIIRYRITNYRSESGSDAIFKLYPKPPKTKKHPDP